MSRSRAIFDDEWLKKQTVLSRIDRLIDLIDAHEAMQPPNNATLTRYVIFVTGRTGAGKTTLGENFNKLDNFIHWDGDQFAYGGDPIKDSGKGISKQTHLKRNEKISNVFTLAVEKGYMPLFDPKSNLRLNQIKIAPFAPFYELIIARVKKILKEQKEQEKQKEKEKKEDEKAEKNNSYRNIIITQAVYPFVVREYLRQLFVGSINIKFIFVILNTSVDLLNVRVRARTELSAKEQGKTLDEYCQSFNMTPKEWDEAVTRNQKGFELMIENEENTIQIDINKTMTKQDVFNQVKQQLNLTFGLNV